MNRNQDAPEIDALLREAGEQWRSQQAPPAEPAWRELSDRRPQQQLIALAAVLTGVAVVGVYGLGVLGTSQPSLSPSAPPTASLSGSSGTPTAGATPSTRPTASPQVSPSPSAADLSGMIVRDGDEVTATGFVCATDAGLLHVYPALPQRTPLSAQVDCGGIRITSVDVSALPGWSSAERQSSYLTVRGIWSDGSIAVTAVEPVPDSPRSSLFDLTDVSCDPPPGGWLKDGAIVDGLDQEEASRGLQVFIDSHPDVYSGSWTGYIPGFDGSADKHAYAVGTVGDVAAAYDELRPMYPYNLCVTAAEFSASELAPVEARLNEGMHGGALVWVANTAPWIDRVWLKLPVLDQAAATLIGADADKVALDPFVRKAIQAAITCELDDKTCEAIVALVRLTHGSEVQAAKAIIVADACADGVICDRFYQIDAVVVIVPADADGAQVELHVLGQTEPQQVGPWSGVLPGRVQRLLDSLSPARVTVEVEGTSVVCLGATLDVCQAVASRVVQNLGRSRPSSEVEIHLRVTCPAVPYWADAGACWQAELSVGGDPVCMVIARRLGDGTFAQVAGDVPGLATTGEDKGCPGE